MSLAYVDTSCLVAVAFDEPGAQELALQLDGIAANTGQRVMRAARDAFEALAQSRGER